MKDKRPYVKPLAVNLDKAANGFGANCAPGSSNDEDCTGNGNNAIGGGCLGNGISAQNGCDYNGIAITI
jgi:hypothetical protein